MNKARYILYTFVLLIAVILYFQSINTSSRVEYQKEFKKDKTFGAISMDITGDVTKKINASICVNFNRLLLHPRSGSF